MVELYKEVEEWRDTYSNNTYTHTRVLVPQLTDYTGRWKIVTENANSILYIECFNLHTYPHSETIKKDVTVPYFDHWWEDLFGAKPKYKIIQKEEVVKSTKIRANVEWVHEDKLTVKIETINTCSGDCE